MLLTSACFYLAELYMEEFEVRLADVRLEVWGLGRGLQMVFEAGMRIAPVRIYSEFYQGCR